VVRIIANSSHCADLSIYPQAFYYATIAKRFLPMRAQSRSDDGGITFVSGIADVHGGADWRWIATATSRCGRWNGVYVPDKTLFGGRRRCHLVLGGNRVGPSSSLKTRYHWKYPAESTRRRRRGFLAMGPHRSAGGLRPRNRFPRSALQGVCDYGGKKQRQTRNAGKNFGLQSHHFNPQQNKGLTCWSTPVECWLRN